MEEGEEAEVRLPVRLADKAEETPTHAGSVKPAPHQHQIHRAQNERPGITAHGKSMSATAVFLSLRNRG